MKTIAALFFCLLIAAGIVGGLLPPVTVLAADAEPRISLTVNEKPLGEVLESLAADTGYRFKLNSQWDDYPVSATIKNLPLEQGLKRLLRSLNHTIIWESGRTVHIMVYGKAENANTGGAISFAAPPQDEVAAPEAPLESEPESVPAGDAGDGGDGNAQPAATHGGGSEVSAGTGEVQAETPPPEPNAADNGPDASATE